MRVYIVLNEKMPKDASDVYSALDSLRDKKIVTNYKICSYIYELEKKSPGQVIDEICSGVLKGGFQIVLWMHPQRMKLSSSDLKKLKKLKNMGIIFGLWDGDIFNRVFKQIPRTLIQIGGMADVAFVQGLGYFSNKMKEIGSKRVEFVPAVGDQNRFYINKKPAKIKYDIVFIGNNYERVFSFMDEKGSKLRRSLVKLFSDTFGDRFAVFGLGWEGYSSNHGQLSYNQQKDIYHSSRIALGTNNPSAKYYFSDRLPIAMLSGKPVVYSYEDGLDVFFKDKGVFFYKDEHEALELVRKILKQKDREFEKYKCINSEFARSKLTMDRMMEYMVTYLISLSKNTQKPINIWMKNL